MEYTKNYHLPQWSEEDRIMMTDFNAMCAWIEAGLTENSEALTSGLAENDEALAALQQGLGTGEKNCRIAWGSYAGNNKFGAENPTTLRCDFYPVAVLLHATSYKQDMSIVLSRGQTSAVSVNALEYTLQISWLDDGVSYYTSSEAYAQFNESRTTYYYVILGYSK